MPSTLRTDLAASPGTFSFSGEAWGQGNASRSCSILRTFLRPKSAY